MVRILAFTSLLACSVAFGQQVSGSISGTVRDNQQAVIAGAKVTLINAVQGFSRETQTNAEGYYLFTSLQPSTYNLTVEQSGFKKAETRDIKIFASDRLTIPVVMEIGQLSEIISVEGQVAQVQTQGAERSGVLTGKQVVDVALISRSFLDLVRVQPGIIYTGGLGGISANGNRTNQNNLTVDGVTNVDTGSNGGELATLNIDQMAEFKVITNAQPAEFGRSSGAQIQVVTKSGTKEFHGGGYDFYRHESLNANRWRDNIDGRQRQLYRFNYAGFNVGGPVLLPGGFNKNKDKLFFFMGMEWQNQLVANTLRNVRLPTVAERRGDFSNSIEGGGAPVRILDPTNGQPFPNMTIPASRFNADGAKILNFYPTPNAEGRDPAFNHQTQISHSFPRREETYRGDYNINEKWRLYSRFLRTKSQQNMPYGQWNADYNVPFGPMNFGNPGWSFVTNLTTVINPTLTNEFIFGSSKNQLNIDPVDDSFNRSKLNLNYRMPFADADKLGLVQNWRFGGVPNAPFTNFAGTPFRNFNHTWDFTNNTVKVLGAHTLKAGMYVQYSQKDQTAFTSINGDIWFDRDASNPGDTNWAYANALLGNYQRLAQSNTALNGQYRYLNIEWFVQDSWRVNSKLTVDYGMRFYWIQPQYDAALQTSSFNPALYDRANTAVLRQIGLNAQGQRISINPITGEQGPFALQGTLVNTGRGFEGPLYANGMGRAGRNYPRGLINNRGIHYAPRLGIAYQFLPKTVLRAGGGVFYDRFQGNPVFDMLPNPPSTIRPTFFFGNLGQIPPASAGIFAPPSVNGFDQGGHIPTTFNFNASIQRELRGNLIIDIGYVGSRSLHNIIRVNQNAVPFGSAWLPQNQDPANPNPQFDGSTTRPVNFYRPFPGYENVNILGFGGYSSYHSLQVSANKRFGNGLVFGLAYTWGRALGVGTGDGDFVHPVNFNLANKGPLGFDIPHRLAMNWVYDVPKVARGGNFLDNKLGRGVFNDWQISGIFEAQKGVPTNPSFSIDGLGNLNERYTGSVNIGARPVVTGNPLGKERTELAQFDTSVFRLPTLRGATGWEHGNNILRLPSWYNIDASIFKNILFSADGRFRMQLRMEMFNAFNNPQFNAMNTGIVFDRAGNITNLPAALGGRGARFGLGALTGTRDPRRMQLGVKFYF
ncbi:MAG: carboxypeptidase regulatory-like domain-containing protein [Bryobacteraceae bacterium]|nr:carboxypeptidase regulatory-like domain-containing protein [Bryobacteraceae bacterium]